MQLKIEYSSTVTFRMVNTEAALVNPPPPCASVCLRIRIIILFFVFQWQEELSETLHDTRMKNEVEGPGKSCRKR
jgi:hypothetical protein